MTATPTPDDLAYVVLGDHLLGAVRVIVAMDVARFVMLAQQARQLGVFVDPGGHSRSEATLQAVEDLGRLALDFKMRLRRDGILRQLGLEGETVPTAPAAKRRRPRGAAVGGRA